MCASPNRRGALMHRFRFSWNREGIVSTYERERRYPPKGGEGVYRKGEKVSTVLKVVAVVSALIVAAAGFGWLEGVDHVYGWLGISLAAGFGADVARDYPDRV